VSTKSGSEPSSLSGPYWGGVLVTCGHGEPGGGVGEKDKTQWEHRGRDGARGIRGAPGVIPAALNVT
jgi:hypothetical protein